MTTELEVTGMTCQGCEDVIETAIELLDGVEAVDADRYEDIAVIEARSDVSTEDMAEKVRMAGYDASV